MSGGLKPSEGTGYAGGTKDKVFIQDYHTDVTLTINNGTNIDTTPNDGIVDTPKGFQAATNTIPDLRTPQFELCFSVDLTWDQGLQFSVNW